MKGALRARGNQWRIVVDQPGQLFAAEDGEQVLVRARDDGAIVLTGDVFDRPGGGLPLPEESASFRKICQNLADNHWGAYAAFHMGPNGRLGVFRDPVGMRDCVGWRHANVRFVASHPQCWLRDFPPASLEIDWTRIAMLLAHAWICFEESPLSGLDTIAAGSIVRFDGDRATEERLWQPRQFYDAARAGECRPASLRDTITRCTSCWLSHYPNSLLEISGGFDSAVVAAAGIPGGHRMRRGINFFSSNPAGDERLFARAVSDYCKISLDEVAMPVKPLDETDLEGMPTGIRPGLGSATLFHDRQLARSATAAGLSALFTGHGGDSVFFQHPAPAIAADPSFPRTSIRALETLARWSNTSTWSVAWRAFNLPIVRRSPAQDDAMARLPLTWRPDRPRSQWAGNLDGLPPAKRMQIDAIAGDRSAFGPSWRSAALTVVHPLLSQPLVEQTLGIDVFVLTGGRRDRALAREALVGLMPPLLTERRGKGSLTHFFGRTLAASVPFLRAYLLDGLLVRNHLFDRGRLEAMLDRDFLMRVDCYAPILSAILVEHWVRHWDDRIRTSPSPDGALGAPRCRSSQANTLS